MTFQITDINWVAVVAATFAYSAFSGFWHRQFAFGKNWENAMGFERPDNWKETSIYFVVPLMGCLTASVAMAMMSLLLNVNTFNEAFMLGIIAGVGLAMTVTFTNAVIPIMKKPLIFGAITGTAHAIGITLVSIIIYAIGS